MADVSFGIVSVVDIYKLGTKLDNESKLAFKKMFSVVHTYGLGTKLSTISAHLRFQFGANVKNTFKMAFLSEYFTPDSKLYVKIMPCRCTIV
jgi:hypothetical protein